MNIQERLQKMEDYVNISTFDCQVCGNKSIGAMVIAKKDTLEAVEIAVVCFSCEQLLSIERGTKERFHLRLKAL